MSAANGFNVLDVLERMALQAMHAPDRNLTQLHEDGIVREAVRNLVEAMRWYEEQAAGCRKLGRIGEPYRIALDRDGGDRARTALTPFTQEPKP